LGEGKLNVVRNEGKARGEGGGGRELGELRTRQNAGAIRVLKREAGLGKRSETAQ